MDERLAMKTAAGIICLLCFGIVLLMPSADLAAPPVNKVGAAMQQKLGHAQKVLESLVREDYDEIDQQAQQLLLISQDASWRVLQTPEYLQHSTEFRRAANAISVAAKDKNIDGAALSYLEMTMMCVNCHKYVRDVDTAHLEPPAQSSDSQPAQ